MQELSDRGLRLLAVAARTFTEPAPTTADEAEADLDLLGLLAFEDPPRPEARDALAACRRAGISVAMITGDSRAHRSRHCRRDGSATARRTRADRRGTPRRRAGARGARGSRRRGDRPGDAGGQTPDRPGTPARGHVIAMTGDGVNDGPALREADIGIAMGASGSDVAREAADLVLLDDNFATIVAAVEQGRATFANARRFLTYHLTDNVAELTPFVIWALSGGQFPLAIGVLQILALDIGTDTLSAVALGGEPAGAHVMTQPPSSGRLLNRTVATRAFGVLGPTEALFEMTAFIVALHHRGLASRGRIPDRPRPVRSVGRSLSQRRRRPGSERVRLPQHSPSGVGVGLVLEPVPPDGDRHRHRVRALVVHHPRRSRTPRAAMATGRRVDRHPGVGTRRRTRRRHVETAGPTPPVTGESALA